MFGMYLGLAETRTRMILLSLHCVALGSLYTHNDTSRTQ